jgi:hypothetical protein
MWPEFHISCHQHHIRNKVATSYVFNYILLYLLYLLNIRNFNSHFRFGATLTDVFYFASMMHTIEPITDDDASADNSRKKKKKRKQPRFPCCHLCCQSLRDLDDSYLTCHVCHHNYCSDCRDEGQVEQSFECTLCFRNVCDGCTLQCDGDNCRMSYCLRCWHNDSFGSLNKDGLNLCFECVAEYGENQEDC